MNATKALLRFANLLEVARMVSPANAYVTQEALIENCRQEKRAFLASMPVRHRFHCGKCGLEATEVELYFEDPTQDLSAHGVAGMWGTSRGRSFSVDLSFFHQMLCHNEPLPRELVQLLAGVQ